MSSTVSQQQCFSFHALRISGKPEPRFSPSVNDLFCGMLPYHRELCYPECGAAVWYQLYTFRLTVCPRITHYAIRQRTGHFVVFVPTSVSDRIGEYATRSILLVPREGFVGSTIVLEYILIVKFIV